MLKYLFSALSLVTLAATAWPGMAADLEAGKQKSQSCAACHGADGNSTNPDWPKLAGQHVRYTVKQLLDFKAGDRQNAQMAPMASPLSEADMHDIAAYYASRETGIGSTDPASLEQGEKIYRYGNAESGVPACMACHGPDGAGNPAARYPRLSGQHAAYTTTQLRAFRAGERDNDANRVMRIVAEGMSDAEIEAVSQYIQGLH
jgi:cytochrome c553